MIQNLKVNKIVNTAKKMIILLIHQQGSQPKDIIYDILSILVPTYYKRYLVNKSIVFSLG